MAASNGTKQTNTKSENLGENQSQAGGWQGRGGEQLKKLCKDRPQRLKKEKVLKLPLGAYRLPCLLTGRKKKKEKEREGKEGNQWCYKVTRFQPNY